MLQRMWNELRLDEIYRFGWQQMRTLPQVLFGRNLPKITHVLRSVVSWTPGISRRWFATGSPGVESPTISTAETRRICLQCHRTRNGPHDRVCSNRHTNPSSLAARPGASRGSNRNLGGAHSGIGSDPGAVPAVRVGDQLFVDGSLRQNTPIRPAMHLGAQRLLVVGLRHQGQIKTSQDRAREEAKVIYPNAVFMLGKMLNALMLDKLEADLARIRRTNELVRAGTEIYGRVLCHRHCCRNPGAAGAPLSRDQVGRHPTK